MKRSLSWLRLALLGLFLPVSIAAWSSGSADFDQDSDVDLADHANFSLCLTASGPFRPPGPELESCMEVFDADADGDVDLADAAWFQCNFTGRRIPARIPSQDLALDNIAIHDPQSDRFDGDCIACHGTRRDEVALDGVTPVAHAKMITVLGSRASQGNELCVYCHQHGVDFVTMSAGGLRRQVDIWETECALCHIEAGPPDTPWFYVRIQSP